ncbi:5'-methylthioadenosine/S-adenosylhomocysteine nucleosidase [Tetragenococcus solitarius]|uniref:adenosylhomocysteine nucleosidase n=1 Tax=Tetragenococcus solitarius TaxID=71453 RepID=A0ABN3YD24_9ENTE|nr:5'-methylthioadenosine/S-adenosylhomocysteine nucleosidase [Tetragenococcus solitarius]
MKIAIIAAMQEEVAPFRKYYTQRETIWQKGKTSIEKLTEEIYLVESGIGKVNAAASTAWLYNYIVPDLIINTGTTGTFAPDSDLGEILLSDRFVYSDVDATGFDYQFGQVPQMPADYPIAEKLLEKVMQLLAEDEIIYHLGTIVTSDSFMSNVGTIQKIRENFPALIGSDMESCAIAQVASFYQTPVLNVRAISDKVGDKASQMFDDSVDDVSVKAFEAVQVLLRGMI